MVMKSTRIIPLMLVVLLSACVKQPVATLEFNGVRFSPPKEPGRVCNKPVPHSSFKKGFGKKKDYSTGITAFHPGHDYVGAAGDPVYSMTPGLIQKAETQNKKGVVWVEADSDVSIHYEFITISTVKVGDTIQRGHLLGYLSDDWKGSVKPHLHLEVHRKGLAIDPFLYNCWNPSIYTGL